MFKIEFLFISKVSKRPWVLWFATFILRASIWAIARSVFEICVLTASISFKNWERCVAISLDSFAPSSNAPRAETFFWSSSNFVCSMFRFVWAKE